MNKKSPFWHKAYERGAFVYLCIAAWFAYFAVVPSIMGANRLLGLAFIVFPGLYISSLVIYFQHETWHNYFDTRFNRALFVVLTTIVFMQPHLYDVAHRTHHARVNTHDDLELYPIGKIENRFLRALCNCMSIVFGSLFLLVLSGQQPDGMPRWRAMMLFLRSVLASAMLWGGVAATALLAGGASVTDLLLSYGLTIWLVSFCHHHNELIEHGNLIVEGDFRFRSSQTRNLCARGWAERVFLFMMHQDGREHTLHHTDPSLYLRPFIGRHPMPPGATHISFRQYLGILREMALGREQVINQGITQAKAAA